MSDKKVSSWLPIFHSFLSSKTIISPVLLSTLILMLHKSLIYEGKTISRENTAVLHYKEVLKGCKPMYVFIYLFFYLFLRS